MSQLKGTDISDFQGQPNFDVLKTDVDFVLTKATEGVGFTAQTLQRNKSELRRVGLPHGFYHFASVIDPIDEANYFVNQIGDYQKGELLMLDWEPEAFVANPPQWALQWLQRVESLTGTKPLIYMNSSTAQSFDWSPVVQNNNGLVVANYGVDDGSPHNAPGSGWWPFWAIWQYTSRGVLDGITGNVDLDIFNGDAAALARYGGVDGVPAPQPIAASNSSDYPGAEAHFVPRSFMFNYNAHIAIVIHKTGGDATPQAVYNTFIHSGNPGKSAHYAIGQDGSIWQYVPEKFGAGANGITDDTTDSFWFPYMQEYGNLNTCTISIEHCDPSPQNDTPLTPEQKQASFALVAHLCQKYDIAADYIKPHRSIVNTICPGTYPMDELIHFIEQGNVTQPVSRPVPLARLASNPSISDTSIRQRRKEPAAYGSEAFPGSGHQPTLGEENRQLKRKLERMWQERDMLKKTIALFSHDQQ